MTASRRVVVTGMGVVSPLGNTVSENWSALLAGKSGIDKITHFDASNYRCQIGGEIRNLDLTPLMEPREIRHHDPFCQFAVAAAEQAVAQAGLKDSAAFDPTRVGVLVSSGIGGLITLSTQITNLNARGPGRVSPMTVPMMISDMAAGRLAIRYNFQGPNFGIVSACATGLHAIGEAYWLIQRDDADIVLAGGAEASITPIGQAGFSALRALSERNHEPQRASRPFDLGRDGFVPAEGAGVLVLEDAEHARRRGAEFLAEVVGYGATGDAFHITAPHEEGDGAARAISMAFRHARLPVDALGYVNAHGTSTPLNDKVETIAIKRALGDHARRVSISSTKSMTGHMLGAAGSYESVVCIEALRHGCIPPTINLETPDPDCDLDYVPNQARELDFKLALNISMGFGGHNAAVLFQTPA
ncbi:MAG TPA: beta-ketoacyl-ACP synthase II [Lentisphaeria bacterium]|nr:beta-ketoacyl-ACP synthase II [Lentisphaerota bacterium]OQC16380.1 MAG: 3-oxoacyl-(acyl-carrier-protein) synthase 2 [Lentisphaerae bacterium ADurb.Bin082]HQC51539.1 beta-ketoacyl-ACP synthase II [Lentisphaeria bacterium]HQL87926.1 beta-ketoacyl-ACP synthase II [Lentisphaeria bacterium]